MSITPIDKPPDGEEPRDETLSRRSWSLRKYAGRFLSWLGERVAGATVRADGDGDSRPVDESGTNGGTESDPEPVTPADCPAFRGFPGREQPLTHPARNSPGINAPDVVSIETDQGLRLSVPENPDAVVTSDVWTTVDP